MTYATQRYLAYGVTLAIAALGFVQLGNADLLGISPRVAAWLAILTSVLGVAAGFLPSVRGMSRDPDFLIRRIEELPEDDQQKVASTLADHAEQGRLISQAPTWLAPGAPRERHG